METTHVQNEQPIRLAELDACEFLEDEGRDGRLYQTVQIFYSKLGPRTYGPFADEAARATFAALAEPIVLRSEQACEAALRQLLAVPSPD